MPEAIVPYFGNPMKVCCDGNCNKAWGRDDRPRVKLSEDPDDFDHFEYLADGELGDAPANPGSEEGGDLKPRSVLEFPNRWCVRQCERCAWSKPGKYAEPLEVPKFDKRVPNREADNVGIKSTQKINRAWAIERINEIQDMAVAKDYRGIEAATREDDTEALETFVNSFEPLGCIDRWTNGMLERKLDQPFFRFSPFENYSVSDHGSDE